jgi:hypothetical protein
MQEPAYYAAIDQNFSFKLGGSIPCSECSQLLRVCERHFQANRLTTGEGGTALACYKLVLEKDSSNAEALAGLDQIEARYVMWAERALSLGRLNKAKQYLEGLRKVKPESPKLAALEQIVYPKPPTPEPVTPSPEPVTPSPSPEPVTPFPSPSFFETIGEISTGLIHSIVSVWQVILVTVIIIPLIWLGWQQNWLGEVIAWGQASTPKQKQAQQQAEDQVRNRRKKQAEARRQAALEIDKQAWQMACQVDTIASYQKYLNGNTFKQFENEAEKRLLALKKLAKLSTLNPLDYLRLLWWVLVMPQQLIAYRKKFGEEDDRRVGKWLVSTLTWLPLLMPSLALGLEWLPHSYKALPETYLWISAGLVGFWLLAGWLEDLDEDWYIGVLFVLITIMSFICTVFLVDSVESFMGNYKANKANFTAVGMAIFVANCMAFVVASRVESFMASSVAGSVAFLIWATFILWIITMFLADIVASLVLLVMFLVTFLIPLVMFLVIGITEESLKTGTPFWLARLAFLLLIAAHLFLIYYCFLGGWRLFV